MSPINTIIVFCNILDNLEIIQGKPLLQTNLSVGFIPPAGAPQEYNAFLRNLQDIIVKDGYMVVFVSGKKGVQVFLGVTIIFMVAGDENDVGMALVLVIYGLKMLDHFGTRMHIPGNHKHIALAIQDGVDMVVLVQVEITCYLDLHKSVLRLLFFDVVCFE